MTSTTLLDRILDPVTEAFTPEVARRIQDLQADPALHSEIDALREKANAGTLSPQEEAYYRDIVEAIDFISILQAKARRFLTRHPA